ncbi:hypothetical protein P7K49_002521 [Saguinus oedipus]|uniref:Uncharacterized protein n=1 Tax=Saguinus oedipus TaxID=9490 RepID=A0ABQ9WI52_SAGOE|nr:hypothetical protein P7K49_002521 [Saguinus oedipus]
MRKWRLGGHGKRRRGVGCYPEDGLNGSRLSHCEPARERCGPRSRSVHLRPPARPGPGPRACVVPVLGAVPLLGLSSLSCACAFPFLRLSWDNPQALSRRPAGLRPLVPGLSWFWDPACGSSPFRRSGTGWGYYPIVLHCSVAQRAQRGERRPVAAASGPAAGRRNVFS